MCQRLPLEAAHALPFLAPPGASRRQKHFSAGFRQGTTGYSGISCLSLSYPPLPPTEARSRVLC